MYIQFIFVANIRAIVVYPNAHAAWTPTPNLALDFPRQISLINEKDKVMAGFAPKPTRNKPRPIILGESAMHTISTAIVPNPQDTLIATFLPKLSAI